MRKNRRNNTCLYTLCNHSENKKASTPRRKTRLTANSGRNKNRSRGRNQNTDHSRSPNIESRLSDACCRSENDSSDKRKSPRRGRRWNNDEPGSRRKCKYQRRRHLHLRRLLQHTLRLHSQVRFRRPQRGLLPKPAEQALYSSPKALQRRTASKKDLSWF